MQMLLSSLIGEITMKKNTLIILFLHFFIIQLWSCSLQMILEYKYIGNFKLEECKDEDNFSLKISGLCMHSNYVIKKIELQKNDDKLKVVIKISLFKGKNDSGNFLYEFKIPDSVNEVLLGNEEFIIWKRN